jgi:hypothetical protein
VAKRPGAREGRHAYQGSTFLADVDAGVFERDIETINPVRSVVSPRTELRASATTPTTLLICCYTNGPGPDGQ